MRDENYVTRNFALYYERNHLEPEEKAMIVQDLELLM